MNDESQDYRIMVMSDCRPNGHAWTWTGKDCRANAFPPDWKRCDCGRYTWAESKDEGGRMKDETRQAGRE